MPIELLYTDIQLVFHGLNALTLAALFIDVRGSWRRGRAVRGNGFSRFTECTPLGRLVVYIVGVSVVH